MGRLKRDAVYDWLDTNPLYVWRNTKRWTLARFAARLGISTTAAAKWETSAGLPSPSRLLELEELTGIKDLGAKLLAHRKRVP